MRIKAHFLAGSSSVTAVPTLSGWALPGLVAILSLFVACSLRQQRRTHH